jgi:hypothetical protein
MRNFASHLHNAAGLPDIFATAYQNGKNIPNDLKIYQIGHKIYQLAIKYTNWP